MKVTKVLNIKDPEAYGFARAPADRTGESLTQVVVNALRERLDRENRRRSDPCLIDAIRAIQDRVARLPVLDTRSDDDIIGYNEHGVFD